ncbi:hypothetical protein CDAR_25831 [Caerostris darwini]|uniref:Uncharacterized protein n=1 Tax=Caerostris darwini TaxID=1538125 RepID=A0AAV4PI67_9ARAC|nr:hypothetical protein CDAR_25831 [Caerostris darwini]
MNFLQNDRQLQISKPDNSPGKYYSLYFLNGRSVAGVYELFFSIPDLPLDNTDMIWIPNYVNKASKTFISRGSELSSIFLILLLIVGINQGDGSKNRISKRVGKGVGGILRIQILPKTRLDSLGANLSHLSHRETNFRIPPLILSRSGYRDDDHFLAWEIMTALIEGIRHFSPLPLFCLLNRHCIAAGASSVNSPYCLLQNCSFLAGEEGVARFEVNVTNPA